AITQLNNPKWSYVINVNGVANGLTGASSKTVTINSFLLTYKSGDDVSVGVTLEGTAPTVTQTGNQTLVQFRTDIDEKAAMNIDTSAAEAKYNDAQTQITQAQSLPTTQYTAALNDITTATSTI